MEGSRRIELDVQIKIELSALLWLRTNEITKKERERDVEVLNCILMLIVMLNDVIRLRNVFLSLVCVELIGTVLKIYILL